MKKLILITVALLSSVLIMNAQNWSGSTSGNIYYNQGNVGIGITNPSKKLEVATNSASGEFRLRPTNGQYQDYRLDIVAAAADIGAVRMSIKDNVFLKTYGYYNLTGLSLGVAGYEDLLHLKNSGNVGIGTTTPFSTAKLQIKTATNKNIGIQTATTNITGVKINAFNDAGNVNIPLELNGSILAFKTGELQKMIIDANGNVGIGITNPSKKLEVATNSASGEFRLRPTNGQYQDYRLDIVAAAVDIGAVKMSIKDNVFLKTYGYYNLTGLSLGVAGYEDLLHLKNSGNIGIGTTNPQSKLAVNGTITSKEVKVTLDGWSDFVFNSDYKLKDLEEVETFIEVNKHLPDVPSEKEVMENGIALGAMDAKLLQKIEELTLYMIEQNKKTEKLIEKVEILETENVRLNKKVTNLERLE